MWGFSKTTWRSFPIPLCLMLVGAGPRDTMADAIRQGDVARVEALLAAGDPYDEAALLRDSAAAGSVPLLALFFRRGAPVLGADREGVTALHRAAREGRLEAITWLLARGAPQEARWGDGLTPLADAAAAGQAEAAELLVNRGARLSATSAGDWTPLHRAAEAGRDRAVESLLAMGADSSARTADGSTPFRLAVDRGHTYAARLLHDHELFIARQRIRLRRLDGSGGIVRFIGTSTPKPRGAWQPVLRELLDHESVPRAFQARPGGDDAANPLVVSATPNGRRRFLGPLGRQSVRVALDRLPPHQVVRVTCDLLILDSWDGGRYGTGWDRWKLAVDGGEPLIDTTFFNCTESLPAVPVQSFPDMTARGFYPGRTDAFESNTLGYVRKWDNDTAWERDAVYRIEVTFAHTRAALALDFTGNASSEIDDESWGLDNVSVQIAP
jgi:hypothetical protein